MLPSIAPTVRSYKLLHGSGHRGWARRLETPAPGRLRCQQEDPSGGHRLPWGVPLQPSDTSGPLRGSNPSVFHVSGPRGHRGNRLVGVRRACCLTSGPRGHRGNVARYHRWLADDGPAHAGTGATVPWEEFVALLPVRPTRAQGQRERSRMGRSGLRPAHAGTGATIKGDHVGIGGSAPPPAGEAAGGGGEAGTAV